jgi:hypothetical protein
VLRHGLEVKCYGRLRYGTQIGCEGLLARDSEFWWGENGRNATTTKRC